MMAFTPEAQGLLDGYLERMRRHLAGLTSVDSEEVRRDVMDHIERGLQGQPEPVESAALQPVLDRLGPPEQWVPEEDLPPWRRLMRQLRGEKEDWRLAYSALGVFILGLAWLPRFSGLAMLIGGFVLGRAALSAAGASGENLGARRWLIYPPIGALYFFLLPAMVIFLLLMAIGASDDLGRKLHMPAAAILLPWLGVYVAMTLLVAARLNKMGAEGVRSLFRPFLDKVNLGQSRLALLNAGKWLILGLVGAPAIALISLGAIRFVLEASDDIGRRIYLPTLLVMAILFCGIIAILLAAVGLTMKHSEMVGGAFEPFINRAGVIRLGSVVASAGKRVLLAAIGLGLLGWLAIGIVGLFFTLLA